MSTKPLITITLDHDVVTLVLEASEAAATDAVAVLRVAEQALAVAKEAVLTAQLDVDTAASRAAFVRLKVEQALTSSEGPVLTVVDDTVDEAG